ncbi:MAG: cytochrome c3 family protein, partial [Acidobacteria bacterium]|nr:cytochrome c3 family protein [Acidobacteriota bacterium]
MTAPTRSHPAENVLVDGAGRRVLRSPGSLAAAVLAVAVAAACTPPGSNGPRQSRGTDASGVAYVADADCADCHRPELDAWAGSHHDLAMQVATPETVLGDFDDDAFTHHGVTSRFFRRGDRFFVNTESPDGTPADFELTHILGVEPLQQYLAPFPGGRLQSLPIAWDTGRNRWFHLYPDERIEPDDPLHWTGRYQTWNLQCAACHSTDLRKGYDVEADAYDTTWAEIDVGCQACHGPGERHVALARGGEVPPGGGEVPPGGGEVPAGGGGDDGGVPAGGGDVPADADGGGGAAPIGGWGLVAPFSADDPAPELDACAPCHSRREQLTPVAAHGGPLLDDFLPARLAEGLYHPDGQILDEVYVYGSFVQSRMHAAGVRCTDCHDPHRLTLRADGNAVCTQCHRERPVDRFPTLTPGRYDTPAHHRHEAGSPGAQCVNCHMPDRTYMVVDPRRDHGFRVPRPDLSAALGTPTPCTGCHDDRDDAWAAAAVAGWSDAPPPPHFAPALAAGRAGDAAAAPALAALAADRGQPAIVRATALDLLRPLGRTAVDAARTALDDADPLVRATAAGGLE